MLLDASLWPEQPDFIPDAELPEQKRTEIDFMRGQRSGKVDTTRGRRPDLPQTTTSGYRCRQDQKQAEVQKAGKRLSRWTGFARHARAETILRRRTSQIARRQGSSC